MTNLKRFSDKQRTCPAGLHFDTSISQCNWPQAANCQARISGKAKFKATSRVAINSE